MSDHAHAEHHEMPFWRKYIFSVDHKVIGIQYAVSALVFLLVGFSLMMIMRWQLAYPGQPLPILGKILGDTAMPGGVMAPEFYNQLGAMHGTIMVFMGVVPLAVGGFGNFVTPLQIGAPDMAFPRLNMISYWAFLPGGLIMLASFFVQGGAAHAVLISMRSDVAGGTLLAPTIAPTPPETPRVLSSKSATSSNIAVQFRTRMSVASFELNVPSRLVDCLGPRGKYHVTLSLNPSMWHAWQAPQA